MPAPPDNRTLADLSKPVLILTDFDGTITRHDSFLRFCTFASGRFRTALAIIKSSPWLLAWKLGMIGSSSAKEKLFGMLFAGTPRMRFEHCCRAFADVIDKDLNTTVTRHLWQMQADGAVIVIASASIADWIKPWADRNAIARVIATEIGFVTLNDGQSVVSGKFSTPNCLKEEKARRIRDAIPSIDDYRVIAFGNLPDDAAMLDMAGERHVV